MPPPPAQNDSDSHNKRTLLENAITQPLSAHQGGGGLCPGVFLGTKKTPAKAATGKREKQTQTTQGTKEPLQKPSEGIQSSDDDTIAYSETSFGVTRKGEPVCHLETELRSSHFGYRILHLPCIKSS